MDSAFEILLNLVSVVNHRKALKMYRKNCTFYMSDVHNGRSLYVSFCMCSTSCDIDRLRIGSLHLLPETLFFRFVILFTVIISMFSIEFKISVYINTIFNNSGAIAVVKMINRSHFQTQTVFYKIS